MLKLLRRGWSTVSGKIRTIIRPGYRRVSWRNISRWGARNKTGLLIGGGVAAAGATAYFIHNALERSDIGEAFTGESQNSPVMDGPFGTSSEAVSRHVKFSRQLSDVLNRIISSYSFKKDPLVLNGLYIQLAVLMTDYVQSIPSDEHEIEMRRSLSLLLNSGYLGLTVDSSISDPTMLSYFSQSTDSDEVPYQVDKSLRAILALSGSERNLGIKLRSYNF